MADKNTGRKYRNWSKIEDAKLVDALVNMVNIGGYKADNGFKSGYLQHLEQSLKVTLPDSNILGRPHIESRIKTMKKDWQIVHDMLHGTNTSGFGYDSVKMCVTADNSVWDSYLQVHKEASKWRNKPFPHYEDLSYVFGKDRAHGNQARDYVGLDEHVAMEDSEMPSEGQQSDENMESPTVDSQIPSQEFTSKGSRKRNRRSDPLVDAIKNAAVILGDRIGSASKELVKLRRRYMKRSPSLVLNLSKWILLHSKGLRH